MLRFGDVAGNDDGVLELARHLVEQLAPPAREDDAVAVGGEPPRTRRADAASRSGDDDGLHPRQPTRYSPRVPPHLDAIGIVTADMAASCRFYALLGVPVGEPADGEDHFEATLPSGLRLMWDSVGLMKQLDPHWEQPVGHPLGLAFHCGSAAGVDETHAAIVAAGFESKSDPWDAFWGQRYAQVLDPDGNAVDLFAPLDG